MFYPPPPFHPLVSSVLSSPHLQLPVDLQRQKRKRLWSEKKHSVAYLTAFLPQQPHNHDGFVNLAAVSSAMLGTSIGGQMIKKVATPYDHLLQLSSWANCTVSGEMVAVLFGG